MVTDMEEECACVMLLDRDRALDSVEDGDGTGESLSVTDCVSVTVSSLVLVFDSVLDGSTDNDRVGFTV